MGIIPQKSAYSANQKFFSFLPSFHFIYMFTAEHSQPETTSPNRRRTKLNQESREHRNLLTCSIQTIPWGRQQMIEDRERTQHSMAAYQAWFVWFLLWATVWTVIQFTGRERDRVSFVTISLNYAFLPILSLLISHIYGGNFGRRLKTLNFVVRSVRISFCLSAFIFKFC